MLVLVSKFVWLEVYHLITHPIIDLFQTFLQRCQLISHKYLRRLHRIPKPAGVIRDNPHHLRRHSVCAEQVVTAGLLDNKKSSFVATSLNCRILMPSALPFGAYMNRLRKLPSPFVSRIVRRIRSTLLLLCAVSVIYRM